MQKQQYHLTSLHQAIPIPACFLSPTKDTSRRKARETFIILPNLASSPVNFLASRAARSDWTLKILALLAGEKFSDQAKERTDKEDDWDEAKPKTD